MNRGAHLRPFNDFKFNEHRHGELELREAEAIALDLRAEFRGAFEELLVQLRVELALELLDALQVGVALGSQRVDGVEHLS